MGMVIDCALYESGRRIATVDLDDAGPAGSDNGRFVWIGLHEPDETLLRKVQKRFGLHDLAIEDAHRAHQRAKLEVYGESIFIVLRTVQLQDGKIGFGETHIFAGRGYVVTVRHGASTAYKDVRARCENAPKMLQKGEDFVVYSVMDFVVDTYFPILHELEGEVDAIEESVFARASGRIAIERVYELRHDLLLMRRAVQPLQEVCSRIIRFDVEMIDADMHPYFRDVQDHIIRAVESIDNLRDLLNAALEANLLLASIQQNDVTKKLAAWAAMLAVPTAIAGIYGMNFDHMPELKQPLGYPIVLLTIAGLCGWLYMRFRRAGWL
ncbi:MAG TPA: magnesium/cobalt transporter CorA [Beijerinckiaceae bacterium]|jgi:magnesium transporter|nr:magnesium/cobalt transporter CorA [Beijerinckiaceae bacterium]